MTANLMFIWWNSERIDQNGYVSKISAIIFPSIAKRKIEYQMAFVIDALWPIFKFLNENPSL
jgi:hypothetical protein